MIVKALESEDLRHGPAAFPEIDFGETLIVPTPAEGGDGKAINEYRTRLRAGMRSAAGGTMSERDEALRRKAIESLTTD
jgi:hypothetical protein